MSRFSKSLASVAVLLAIAGLPLQALASPAKETHTGRIFHAAVEASLRKFVELWASWTGAAPAAPVVGPRAGAVKGGLSQDAAPDAPTDETGSSPPSQENGDAGPTIDPYGGR